MTLWELEKAKSAKVKEVDDTLDLLIIARLREMGLAAGRDVECVRRGPLGGPMVMQMGGSVYAMEQALASRIEITPIN